LRAHAEITELASLSDATTAGKLDEALTLRLDDYNAYASDGTGAIAKGAKVLADDEKTAADAAVLARVLNSSTGAVTTAGGPLVEARATAQTNWDTAKAATTAAENALTTALDSSVLETLRSEVAADTTAWDTQQTALAGLITAVANAEDVLTTAQEALDAEQLSCRIDAYDAYRTTLEEEMVQRNADLKTIKALVEAQLARPDPGTAGARCEKALSNGTFRPARTEVDCGGEGTCCGAARVWMDSGSTADAGWRTIETCGTTEQATYDYQPPRAPMATTMPATLSVPFTCIEGAKKLAAAASAVAAAVYMLA
jgi:hypothetical protein